MSLKLVMYARVHLCVWENQMWCISIWIKNYHSNIFMLKHISTGTGLPVYMLCSSVTSAPICLLYSASCLKLSPSSQSQWINLLWAEYFLFCMKIGCTHQTACTVQLISQTMIMTTIDNYATNGNGYILVSTFTRPTMYFLGRFFCAHPPDYLQKSYRYQNQKWLSHKQLVIFCCPLPLVVELKLHVHVIIKFVFLWQRLHERLKNEWDPFSMSFLIKTGPYNLARFWSYPESWLPGACIGLVHGNYAG